MKLTYNRENTDDVLLVTLKKAETPSYEYLDGVTVIKDGKETIGLNIFNAGERIQLPEDVSIKPSEAIVGEINNILSKAGTDKIEADLTPKFVAGRVVELQQHPDSQKLSVTKVDVGNEVLQIVCGAPNVKESQLVVVAKTGAVMPDGLYIKPSALRGVESEGMICSAKELNLEDDGVKGIYVLDDSYEIGQPFDVK